MSNWDMEVGNVSIVEGITFWSLLECLLILKDVTAKMVSP